MLRGRCACNSVAFEVADAFTASYNCHCSNCRALTGSAFLSWGEIASGELRTTRGEVRAVGDAGADQAFRCVECDSLLYWTVRSRDAVRVPYGTLVDEPTLKPTAHMFVGSKAPWYEITDDLPQYDEYPWSSSEG